MNVAIIGSGGREHALALALAAAPNCTSVTVIPGNPGMMTHQKIKVKSVSDEMLLDYLVKDKIELVVIGPEAPLAQGLSDKLENAGFSVFGPTQSAARLESSKIFCKQVLVESNVRTARYQVANNFEDLKEVIEKVMTNDGVVLKADGLASGKGVIVSKNKKEALAAAQTLLEKYSGEILVEELVKGREVSAMYLCNGKDFIALGEACDHKRLLDDDLGPNTGGMGAYSPVPWLTENLKNKISSEVIAPVLNHMHKMGAPFYGILFAGLMIENEQINVLEFNVRFGDPETQTLLPRLKWNALDAFLAVATRDNLKFKKLDISQNEVCCVHVVKASEGYPENPIIGKEIQLSSKENIYFAGVKNINDKLVTAGGRVLGATGMAETLELAREQAYKIIDTVNFSGSQCRLDIGRNV